MSGINVRSRDIFLEKCIGHLRQCIQLIGSIAVRIITVAGQAAAIIANERADTVKVRIDQ